MTDEFKKIIDEDILKCENEIKNGSNASMSALHSTLISKYGSIIDGFKKDLKDLFYDQNGEHKRHNLETMRQKLLLFKAMDYKNIYAKEEKGFTVTTNNQFNATVSVSVSDVKEQINNMTALSTNEINEIQSQIDKLEKIINSKNGKSKKWESAKDIIKWLADKGVDVGIAMLPLLLKIGQ